MQFKKKIKRKKEIEWVTDSISMGKYSQKLVAPKKEFAEGSTISTIQVGFFKDLTLTFWTASGI